jgi:hypothetical protein
VDGHHVLQRHHLPVLVLDPQGEDVGSRRAILGIGGEVHLEHPAAQREVVDVARAEMSADRGVDVAHAQAQPLGPGPVHLDIELRNRRAVGRAQEADVGRLVGLGEKGPEDLGQLLRRGTFEPLQAKVEATDGADAGDRRRREDADDGAGNGRERAVEAIDDRGDLELVRGALVPRVERGDDHRAVRRDGALQDGEPRDRDGDALGLLDGGGDLVEDLLRARQRRRVGQLEIDEYCALVLVGQEGRGQRREEPGRDREAGREDGEGGVP